MTNYAFDITTEPDSLYNPDHAIIAVTAPDPTGLPLINAIAANRWAAGFLGRLAATLLDDLASARTTHRCTYDPEEMRSGCHITPLGLKDPHVLDDAAKLEIEIPAGQLQQWERRIRKHLKDLLKGDEWTPSHTEQAAWTYADNTPKHLTAPRTRQEQHQ